MTPLQYPLLSSQVQQRARKIGIRRAGETVSPLFLTFCFPLRLQVSLLFLNIKTKAAAVRDAAGSWKLGVKRNEECFFADWPTVVVF